MNLEMITEGLKQLLQENNYSSATIRFYEGEWNKIQCFLTEEYGNTGCVILKYFVTFPRLTIYKMCADFG